jgi:hypothetical protein
MNNKFSFKFFEVRIGTKILVNGVETLITDYHHAKDVHFLHVVKNAIIKEIKR